MLICSIARPTSPLTLPAKVQKPLELRALSIFPTARSPNGTVSRFTCRDPKITDNELELAPRTNEFGRSLSQSEKLAKLREQPRSQVCEIAVSGVRRLKQLLFGRRRSAMARRFADSLKECRGDGHELTSPVPPVQRRQSNSCPVLAEEFHARAGFLLSGVSPGKSRPTRSHEQNVS